MVAQGKAAPAGAALGLAVRCGSALKGRKQLTRERLLLPPLQGGVQSPLKPRAARASPACPGLTCCTPLACGICCVRLACGTCCVRLACGTCCAAWACG